MEKTRKNGSVNKKERKGRKRRNKEKKQLGVRDERDIGGEIPFGDEGGLQKKHNPEKKTKKPLAA